MKVIEHAETNTREAFAAMRAAAGAKNPAEVAKIQGDYLRQQGARSMAHAREIGELIMQFGRDATGAKRRSSARTRDPLFRDGPARAPFIPAFAGMTASGQACPADGYTNARIPLRSNGCQSSSACASRSAMA